MDLGVVCTVAAMPPGWADAADATDECCSSRSDGRTPLHDASQQGYLAALHYLCDTGAEKNPAMIDGRTPTPEHHELGLMTAPARRHSVGGCEERTASAASPFTTIDPSDQPAAEALALPWEPSSCLHALRVFDVSDCGCVRQVVMLMVSSLRVASFFHYAALSIRRSGGRSRGALVAGSRDPLYTKFRCTVLNKNGRLPCAVHLSSTLIRRILY